MATHYGDFHGFVTSVAEAYPISYSGAGLFDMSPMAAELMELLPSYFFLGNNNRRIMEMIAVILSDYQNKIDEVRDQFFVETATWGLVYWEQLVGLPINDGSLDYEARRAAILNKLRDCSSEKCFVEGVESIINGQAIVIDLDPVTNPYQIHIELKSGDLTYAGPKSAPTAAAYGTGPLDGDYTYRVTYEFDPVVIPDYITLFPYTNFSGLYGNLDIIGQRQYVKVVGTGSFWLRMGGFAPNNNAGPLTHNSTAQDVVNILRPYLEEKYGEDAVSTPFPDNVVGTDGVLLVFEGPYTKGLNLPELEVVNRDVTITSATAVIAGYPEFIQLGYVQPPADSDGNIPWPQLAVAETPSGIAPTKVNEIQELGQGLFNPATVLAPVECEMYGLASAGMTARVRNQFMPKTITASADVRTNPVQEITTLRGVPALALGQSSTTLSTSVNNRSASSVTAMATTSMAAYVDTVVVGSEIGDAIVSASASASMAAAVTYAADPAVSTVATSIANLADGLGPLSLLITPDSGVKFAYSELFASASTTMSANMTYAGDPAPTVGKATSSLHLVINPPTGPMVVAPITGGDFVIKYNTMWDMSVPPVYETTAPIAYNASPTQIKSALEALPSIYPNCVEVSGGPLPSVPVTIEFKGTESGYPQALLVVDSSGLVGGGFYEVVRNQAGHTTYSGSESNTVSVSGTSVLLTNVPRSPDGASKRNIYRKKTQAPYNEWRYVGSVNDNYATIFVDAVSDVDLSEVQELKIFGNGSFKLRFDSLDTTTLFDNSNAATVEAAIDAITSVTYPDVDVTVTGTSPSFEDGGLIIKFNAGDVVGKDVPKMEVVDTSGVTGYVATIGPRKLTERNTAFTYTFQRLVEYIYVTKPAHLRVRELRSSAFRASINVAGDPV